MNKASGGDEIPVELFQILKDDAVKVLLNIPANLENSAEATGLEEFSFRYHPKGRQCQRMLNCHIIALISVQFSHSIMSNSLLPQVLQHTRPPCPSPITGVYSNCCLLSRWCHPTISSSVNPFSSCLQSFPASGSFLWVSSSHQVAEVLELQHQSFQWIVRTDFL